MMGSFYDWVVSLRSVSLSVIKLFRSFSFFNQWLISAQKLQDQHALKGQKLLAQGNALGYYGCKPVALKGQKLPSRDNIL
jgi:hypothetical protein